MQAWPGSVSVLADAGPVPVGILSTYCVLILLASLAGGILPAYIKLTHTRLQILLSLVGGLMLGVGLLHQLPHAVAEMSELGLAGSLDRCMMWMLAGMLVLFLMLRWFHFHQHEAPAELTATSPEHDCGHDHDHGGHSHAHHHHHGGPATHQYSWVFLTLGLALHTIIDGIALASSVQAEAAHAHGWVPPALATFLAIFLHKPLDSLPIASLMVMGGWSPHWRHAVNLAYSSMCPLGALLFCFGVSRFSGQPQYVVAAALAFSAGAFVCIALSDLLPELEFHSHDRFTLTACLFLGVAIAWAIGFLEPKHVHELHPAATSARAGDPGEPVPHKAKHVHEHNDPLHKH